MLNALPCSLRLHTDRIERAVAGWPIEIDIDLAIRWVMQFDSCDYSLAVRIIENLDVVGPSGVRSALEIAHTKLLRQMADKGSPFTRTNTIFAGAGNSAKSGSMIAYQYRVAAELPEDDFLSLDIDEQLNLERIENIVLVDDVIGTGRTISREIEGLAAEVYALPRTRNIFVLTVAGYEAGIKSVADATGASVTCALEYGLRDTVSTLDATFYDGMRVEERSASLDRIRRYCRAVSTSDLGFGSVGGLLVFDHNTPNTTLPIIWSTGKGWLPLFYRAKKIASASNVLKSAEAERRKHSPPQMHRNAAELTLFVEGKIDEVFVDHLIAKRDLASRLGVASVTAVALGGLYQSNRLIELLQSAKKHAVFVLDDDEHTRRIESRNRMMEGVHVLYLKPSFVALLDLGKIFTHRDRFPALPEPTMSPEDPDPSWLREVEIAVLRRGPISKNVEFISQLLAEFIDESKCDTFVAQLRGKVDDIFEPSRDRT